MATNDMEEHEERAPSDDLSRKPAIILVLFGCWVVAVSIYLTFVHYANVPLVCQVNSLVNCAAVTTSSWSVIPGTSIPVTIPGMFWGLVTIILSALTFKSFHLGRAGLRLPMLQMMWSGIGLLTALYLIFAELVLVKKLCEWCTSVHIVVIASCFVALWQLQAYARWKSSHDA